MSTTQDRGKERYFPDFKPTSSGRRWYQHDIDVIVYSDMFRKLQRKSQLLSIHDPVSRSRLIHTFEVVRIAKEISEKLGLNTELTEAIALAHDFGNVAYGKLADIFLQKHTSELFKHEEVSALMLKVCASRPIPEKYRQIAREEIEKDTNHTHFIKISEFPHQLEVYQYKKSIYYICMSPEVIDGVIKHGTSKTALTLEGQVVNYADNIAYLIQDISDFEATGIFDRDTKERYEHCLQEFETEDSNKKFPISGVVGKTTSIRTATLIERFVAYNIDKVTKDCEGQRLPDVIYSPILMRDIPCLEIDPLLIKAIDACWKFKEEFYTNELIKVSNLASNTKMNQIWNILDNNSVFVEKNNSYIEFLKILSSPIFNSFRKESEIESEQQWELWKKAFFVAHLTCDEIDLIIKSFLERDYVFDLSLPTIKKK